MLKFGNKEFRNLQEQVEENMKNIQDLMQGQVVLDEFGIKVIGQEASIDDMPTVEEYKEEHEDWSYGDAYAIGEETPYSLYILTRGNNENPDDYWFNIGVFPMPGPRGLQGETGDTGPQGQTGPQGEPGRDGIDGDDALCYDLIWMSNSNPSGGTVLTMAQPTSIRWNRTAKLGDVFLLPWKVSNTNETYLCQMEITEIQADTNYVIAELQNYTQINPVYLTWGNILGTLNNQTDLKNALDGKQAKLTFDTSPRQGSTNPVTSNGISNALSNKQNTLTFDDYPTSGSNNPVKSWGIKQVFDNKQDKLTSTGLPTYTLDKVVGFDSQGNLGIGTAASEVVDWSDIQNKPTFSTVATTGDYDDLSDKPDLSIYAQSGTLSPVAFNGDYRDLNHTPSLGTASSYNATDSVESGSNNLVTSGGVYTAIQNITPFTQVQSDYTQTNTSAVDYIKHKPDLSVYALSSSLSTVATSGDYDDLTNKPTLFDGDYDSLTNKPDLSVYAETSDLSSVAFSGDYVDLSNKPTIPTVDYPVTDVTVNGSSVVSNKVASITVPTDTSDLTNNAGFITSSALSGYVESSDLSTVAFSGDFDDLLNKPTMSDYVEFSDLSTVATTGDYDDLLNKPTIPAAQVNADWNASSGVAEILNKPSLSTVATSGSYNDLTDKPTIPVVSYPVTDVKVDNVSVLNGTVAEITMPTIPTKVSDLQNDSGYITGITSTDVTTALGYTPYNSSNPNGYITSSAISDMATQTWVGNQGYLTSVSWNDVSNKPTFSTVATTGDYDDLLDKPTIPTKTSDLNNDSGFITGITSSDVTTALGYTPYDASNPNGYTSNVGTVTSVNNTQPDANGNVSIAIPPTITITTTSGSESVSDGTNTLSFGSNAFNSTTIPTSYVRSVNNQTGAINGVAMLVDLPDPVSGVDDGSGYLRSITIGNDSYWIPIRTIISDTSGSESISVGNVSLNFGSNAFNSTSIPSVSGTNDGTNWTSLTINSDTYSIPSGGSGSGVSDVTIDGTSIVSNNVAAMTTETWTFTLANGNTVTKKVVLG